MSLAISTPLPILLFTAFTAVSLVGCGLTVTVDDGTTTRTEDQTVAVEGIRTVDVDTENGAVEIRGGTVDEITIRSVRRERHDGDADASVVVDDDRLVLIGDCDGRWWNACSVGFVVTVPSRIDVRVATDNGRVAATGIEGDVTIETDNGAIEASALGSGAVVVDTDNGRIRLTFDEAPDSVEATTDNGSIVIRLSDDGRRYAVDADSGNGAVDIGFDPDPDAERWVVARSDNGSVDIGYRAP